MDDRRPEQPGRYVIRVSGVLDPAWLSAFSGFVITHDADGNTVLCGEVVDQAAFYGLMSRARDLGLTIVSVERQSNT
jgi:hypothetical protein